MKNIILSIIIVLFIVYVVLYTILNEKKQRRLGIKTKKNKGTDTINCLVKAAIFSAFSYLLYFLKFSLPFFPSFLEINFSMFPILLAGFVLGPWWGLAVVLVRFVLKMPFSSTSYVGELADLLIGSITVLTSSLFYNYHKNKKGGLIALVIAIVSWICAGVVTNYFINIPFYVKFYFGGDMAPLIGWLSPLYPNINEENFYLIYLCLAVIPFNALIGLVVCSLTYFIYKRVSVIFKKDFFRTKKTKILIASDSFKGSLSSLEVGQIVAKKLEEKGYQTGVVAISDGGEGFLDSLEASIGHLKRIYTQTYDAFGKENYSSFLYDENTKHAYFELAEVVGIMNTKERNPFLANTYGLGYLIKYAITNYEIDHCFIGIGGSASNDGGSGLLEALGLDFFDKDDNLINNLSNEKLELVERIDNTKLNELIRNIRFTVLTDVINPLLGSNGATYIYSKQKGAKEEDFPLLEKNLEHFKDLTIQLTKIDNSFQEGAGAAGGCGFGIISYLNADFEQGINFILKEVQFSELVKNYDEVITGEGCFDNQSLQGKVISGIMNSTDKPVAIICGISKIKRRRVYSITPEFLTQEESMNNPQLGLETLIEYYY